MYENMADRGWLDAPLPSDEESDSSYVSSSGSESESGMSEMSEISDSRQAKKAVSAEEVKTKISRLFEDMNAADQISVSTRKDDELYAVFNSRGPRRVKDTTVQGVMQRVNLELNPIASLDAVWDDSQYRRRDKPTSSGHVSELVKAVEHEFVEIEEDGIFAGQVVKLKRKVSVHSEEAKRFMKRHKRKGGEQQVSALDSYLESMKMKTVTSMDKTAADWSQFKEAEGISRDLEVERKRGYLVDQAFLAKVSQSNSRKP